MANSNSIIYYSFSAAFFGAIGTCVGCAIAQELGEAIPYDKPIPDEGSFVALHNGVGEPTTDGYTQAGRAWIGGGAGVGALFGILLVMLCTTEHRNAVKNMFTSLFDWHPAKQPDNDSGNRNPLSNDKL